MALVELDRVTQEKVEMASKARERARMTEVRRMILFFDRIWSIGSRRPTASQGF